MFKIIVKVHLTIDKLLQCAMAVIMCPFYLGALIAESLIKKQGLLETMRQAKEELQKEFDKE